MLRYSKELTDEAKNIFGHIINAAYHYMEGYDDEPESETERRLKRSISIDFAIKDGKIEAESSFVIEFTNCKRILFDTSEWMMIKEFKK